MRFKPLALFALCLGALTACHRLKPEHTLILTMEPPQLESGRWLTVTAQVADQSLLSYVSGTVQVMGAWVVPLKYDRARNAWYFSAFIPDMIVIPPGKYGLKAWGQDAGGEYYEGTASVEAN
jgi:hypothetical protein